MVWSGSALPPIARAEMQNDARGPVSLGTKLSHNQEWRVPPDRSLAFQLIVLRGPKPRAVLDREAETLKRLMTETGAPCWQPDPPSTGACQVQ
jgi:hypothetical protein